MSIESDKLSQKAEREEKKKKKTLFCMCALYKKIF